LDIGTVAAGTQQTVTANVRVSDGYLVFDALSGCDSISYMIIKSGFDEHYFYTGDMDTNYCPASTNFIEDVETCQLAARKIGYRFVMENSYDSQPQGCFFNTEKEGVFFNTNGFADTTSSQSSSQPICIKNMKLLIRQTTGFYFGTTEYSLNADNPNADNYAILNELVIGDPDYAFPNYQLDDGSYQFALAWPQQTTNIQRWKQTSNPLTTAIENYSPIDTPYTEKFWGGLEPTAENRNPATSFMTGSVNSEYWFYAVGTFAQWGSANGFPWYTSSGQSNFAAATQVELYIRYDPTQEDDLYEQFNDHKGCVQNEDSMVLGRFTCTSDVLDECVDEGKEQCNYLGNVCWGFALTSGQDIEVYNSDAADPVKCTDGSLGLTSATDWDSYARSATGVKTYETKTGRCIDFEGVTYDFLKVPVGTNNFCKSVCDVDDDCRGYEMVFDGTETCRVLFEILPTHLLAWGVPSYSGASGSGRAIAANGDTTFTCHKIIPDDMCTSDTIYASECYASLMAPFVVSSSYIENPEVGSSANGGFVEFYVQCTTATTFEYEVEVNSPDGQADSYFVQFDGGDWEIWHTGQFDWSYSKGPSYDITDTNIHTVTFHAREDGISMRRIRMLSSDCSWADPSIVTPTTYSFGNFDSTCQTGYVEITDATECDTASTALDLLSFTNACSSGSACVCKGWDCLRQPCQYSEYSETEGSDTNPARYICKLDSSTEVELASDSETYLKNPQTKENSEKSKVSELAAEFESSQQKQSAETLNVLIYGIFVCGIFTIAVHCYRKTYLTSSYELIKIDEEEV